MRISSLITLLLAIVLAGVAGFLAQSWLEQQRRMGQPVLAAKEVKRGTVVVASKPLRFGTPLSEANVKEMEWPTASIPDGAFAKVTDLLKSGERRLALSPVEANELVLAWKITGPGQRASLSSLISEGMKAITIRVNDVNGVAGFVLPGDRIDVMLTRNAPQGQAQQLATEVLLQDVKVLGIDQLADERTDKAMVVKAVTVEVTIADAQRVVLASSVGTLSLALRAAGASGHDLTGRITPADLGPAPVVIAPQAPDRPAAVVVAPPQAESSMRPFGVTRALRRTEYSVPDEKNRSKAKQVPSSAETVAPTATPRPVPKAKPAGASIQQPEQTWSESWSVRTVPSGNTN